MDQVLRKKADDLISIYKQVNKDFRWKNTSSINNLIALSFIMKGKNYSKQDLDRVNDYIRKNTGPFSCYRQKSVLFSALLHLNFTDSERKFDSLLDYEDRLKAAGFRSYTYRPVTAYTLLLSSEPKEIDSRIAKAFEIFTEMRRNHPWLTSGDDYPLSILLAASEEPVSSIMEVIEDLYTSLNEAGFSRSNGLQILSHILSLSKENSSQKAARCRRLYQFFKEHKMKVYSTNYGTLGLLTLLEEQGEIAARDVVVVSKYLEDERSIRWLGKETLFLTATSLVSMSKLDKLKNSSELIHTNAFVTIEALMAAQNAAILGATCAATTAASSS